MKPEGIILTIQGAVHTQTLATGAKYIRTICPPYLDVQIYLDHIWLITTSGL